MTNDVNRAIKNVKDVMTALKYMGDATVRRSFIAQKERIAARLKELDEEIMPTIQKVTKKGEKWGTWQTMDMERKWNTYI
ncbi:hypothetical protein IMZ48_25475, partial [Candidatus Bathyarchaeota archaeon]|nr:hypothetical protein [Candidatus Bathyarchaeota archaeon]